MYVYLLLLMATSCAAKKNITAQGEPIYQWRIKVAIPGSDIGFLNTVFYADEAQQPLAVSLFKTVPVISGRKTLVFYKAFSVTEIKQIRDELYSNGIMCVTIERLNQ
ncbi:hypothetical protein [Mucilaginibacter pineti]|nr:hypothetical protein [Mucilaginibacter pineti]